MIKAASCKPGTSDGGVVHAPHFIVVHLGLSHGNDEMRLGLSHGNDEMQ